MFGLRVWWKDGKIENLYFENEECRKKKAKYYKSLNRVEKVTFFEMD